MHWQQRVGHSRQQLLDDCLAPGLHRVELRPRLARANEAFSSCEPMTANLVATLRPMLGQTRRECCHEPNMAVFEDNEKVTPNCRFGASVRIGSLRFAQAAWLSGISRESERLSERERT